MTKNAIVIIEHRRPNYLWLCLHALQKVNSVSEFDVFVDIDQGGCHSQFKQVTEEFPVTVTLRHSWSGGDLWQWMRALNSVFSQGYEGVVFFEGDTLLRRDALDYLKGLDKKECFISLSSMNPRQCSTPEYPNSFYGYHPYGNWISRENFYKLDEYISAKRYVGQMCCGEIGKYGRPEHDRAFCFFAVNTQVRTQAADKSYLFHFGVNGLNTHDLELESLIFRGDRSQWLDNLLSIKRESPAFVPVDFVYA